MLLKIPSVTKLIAVCIALTYSFASSSYALFYTIPETNVTLEYTISQTTDDITITNCNDDATGDITIPETIDGKTITVIGANAFEDLDLLTKITLPATLISIEDSAFRDCDSLRTVIMPNGLTTIGTHTFEGCIALESITLPDSITILPESLFEDCSSLNMVSLGQYVTYIGVNCFRATGIVSMNLPSQTTQIDEYAFSSCEQLEAIHIGANVIDIATTAFRLCTSLATITVDSENTSYSALNNVLYLLNTLGMPTELIQYPLGSSQSSHTIPNGIEVIPSYAFSYASNLTSIALPESINEVSNLAFTFTPKLQSITVDDGNTVYSDINQVLFKLDSNSNPTELIRFPTVHPTTQYSIPQGTKIIGTAAFLYCNTLTHVDIPDTVHTIDGIALGQCTGLTEITIPDSVESLGVSVFSHCWNLKKISIGSGVTNIGYRTFFGCRSLSNISVDHSNEHFLDISGVLFSKGSTNSVDSLLAYPSGKTSTHYSIPYGVKSIQEPFGPFATIQSLLIPATVEQIDDDSFRYSFDLRTVTFLGDAPTINGLELFFSATVYKFEDATGFDSYDFYFVNLQTLSLNTDSDGDGFSNRLERALNTAPMTKEDQFNHWIEIENNSISLNYAPHSDTCNFLVEWTSDLLDSNSWAPLADIVFEESGTGRKAQLNTSNGNPKFYRVTVSEL